MGKDGLSQDELIVQAYYQGIEDLSNQILSFLRNTDLVQSWELRDLLYSNLSSLDNNLKVVDFTG